MMLKKSLKKILKLKNKMDKEIILNKLIGFVDGRRVVVKRESELVKGTPEYQVSLVLDTLLNIERLKQ